MRSLDFSKINILSIFINAQYYDHTNQKNNRDTEILQIHTLTIPLENSKFSKLKENMRM